MELPVPPGFVPTLYDTVDGPLVVLEERAVADAAGAGGGTSGGGEG